MQEHAVPHAMLSDFWYVLGIRSKRQLRDFRALSKDPADASAPVGESSLLLIQRKSNFL